MTPHNDVSLIDEGKTAQAQHAPSVLDDAIERGIAELNAIRYQRDGEDNPIPNDRRLIERLYAAMFVAPSVTVLTPAARDILGERRQQIEVEGWTPLHDDAHDPGDLSSAAMGYAQSAACKLSHEGLVLEGLPLFWPWEASWFKPSTARQDLVKAGALILAEIERLDRAVDPVDGFSTDRAELPLSSDRADLAASIASAGKVAPDAFASWPRNVLEQLAADLYAFIQELGPHPRERLEQRARYEAVLRTIARQGAASIYVQLARHTINGK